MERNRVARRIGQASKKANPRDGAVEANAVPKAARSGIDDLTLSS